MKSLKKLKFVLLANAVFSAISGLLLIIMNEQLTYLFGLDDGLTFYLIGAGLVIFAIYVGYVAFKKLDNKMQVKTISIADFVWVIGSTLIMVTSAFELSLIGYELIGIVAAVVLIFGVLQLKFNR